MIQIKNKIGTVAPDILIGKGTAKADSHKQEFDNGTIDFDFDAKIYGHKKVKEKLVTLQYGKCCFCESAIDANSYGDVEHYRPKAGWVQENESINKPGYYWLAYNWDNLFFSCQICNEQFKKNYFPLATESTRVKSHHDDINNEDPLFIHPANDNPEDHIEFIEEVPKPKNGSKKGQATIERTGIKRDKLNEKRKRTFIMLNDIYELVKNHPDNQPQLKQKAINIIAEYHNNAQHDETEYASMLRSFFRKNPIDF